MLACGRLGWGPERGDVGVKVARLKRGRGQSKTGTRILTEGLCI